MIETRGWVDVGDDLIKLIEFDRVDADASKVEECGIRQVAHCSWQWITDRCNGPFVSASPVGCGQHVQTPNKIVEAVAYNDEKPILAADRQDSSAGEPWRVCPPNDKSAYSRSHYWTRVGNGLREIRRHCGSTAECLITVPPIKERVGLGNAAVWNVKFVLGSVRNRADK